MINMDMLNGFAKGFLAYFSLFINLFGLGLTPKKEYAHEQRTY
jgi:hypothetical protein